MNLRHLVCNWSRCLRYCQLGWWPDRCSVRIALRHLPVRVYSSPILFFKPSPNITYSGYNGENPNDNPVCNRKITAHCKLNYSIISVHQLIYLVVFQIKARPSKLPPPIVAQPVLWKILTFLLLRSSNSLTPALGAFSAWPGPSMINRSLSGEQEHKDLSFTFCPLFYAPSPHTLYPLAFDIGLLFPSLDYLSLLTRKTDGCTVIPLAYMSRRACLCVLLVMSCLVRDVLGTTAYVPLQRSSYLSSWLFY